MHTETWNVAVTISDDGFDVTAKARFTDCSFDLVGLGVAPAGAEDKAGLAIQAVAAHDALHSLADALGRAAQADDTNQD